MARVLYTAEATVTGGRASGHGRTSDGVLDVQLRSPKEMGGEGDGTNPEQLFAIGYAACFESALGAVGRRERIEVSDVSIDSRVSLFPTAERGYALAVALEGSCRRFRILSRRPGSLLPRIRCVRTRTPPEATSR